MSTAIEISRLLLIGLGWIALIIFFSAFWLVYYRLFEMATGIRVERRAWVRKLLSRLEGKP